MCRTAGTDLYPVDMGMDCEVIGVKTAGSAPDHGPKDCERFRKYREGTCVSRKWNAAGVVSGIELAFTFRDMGYELLAAGEMGIGNTTPAAAMSAVLTGLSSEEATGRGAGLSDAGLEKKKRRFRWRSAAFMKHIRSTGAERRKIMRMGRSRL